MLPNVHGQELIWLFLIILLLFGGSKLPALASSLGRAVKDFKSGMQGLDQEMESAEKAEASKAAEKAAESPAKPAEKAD